MWAHLENLCICSNIISHNIANDIKPHFLLSVCVCGGVVLFGMHLAYQNYVPPTQIP